MTESNETNGSSGQNKRPTKTSKTKQAAKPAAQPKAAESSEDVTSSPLGAVLTRNEFYRDRYRTLTLIAIIEAAAIVGLIAALIITIQVNRPRYFYFATTEDGRSIPMLPLSRPNLSKPALMSWAAQAATEVLTFNFSDYRRRLQEASRHFTREGWESFTQALQASDFIESVVSFRQVVSAAPAKAPVLLYEGVINGRYQWEIELPMLITYQTGSSTQTVNQTIRMVIRRMDKLESPNGVGIQQWNAMRGAR